MIDLPPIDDPNYWRSRADEARAIADQLNDTDAKRTMLDIAAGYERMAARAANRAALKAASPKSTPP